MTHQPAEIPQSQSRGHDAPASSPRYVLRLFVTGATTRSQRAIANMRRICEENLAGRYDLEVIDIYEQPEATRDLQVVATPTLVKVLPEPLRRIIGDLSDREKVLAGLNLTPLFGSGKVAK